MGQVIKLKPTERPQRFQSTGQERKTNEGFKYEDI